VLSELSRVWLYGYGASTLQQPGLLRATLEWPPDRGIISNSGFIGRSCTDWLM